MGGSTGWLRLTQPPLPDLPVREVLGQLGAALAERPAAVLEAPPGAGKTTLVPLALLAEPWLAGRRILMAEPRRLATRAAATRMAQLLDEPVGRTVGYAMRFERRTGPVTRIEVVTEGLLTRRLQADPELTGVGLVIFDEFHERSLDADLGLALALDVQGGLRPDLRLLVMSATLDAAAMANLLNDAPILRSDGRRFPVGLRYRAHAAETPIEAAMAAAVHDVLAIGPGDVLAFLPGAREIRRTAERLAGALDPAVSVVLPLMGELAPAAQDAALRPDPAGRRKIVLATNVAETSLTIEGVRIVVDSGLARRPLFSPRTGMTRLATVRVSRAAAEQRRGRAGRQGPGLCWRLWEEAEDRALAAFDPPEITQADLAGLALELALWGVRDAAALRWPTPPPAGALGQARGLLQELGALDASGAVTPAGRAMAALPLHPRLACMVVRGAALGLGGTAVACAALLAGRDPWRLERDADLGNRLARLQAGGSGGEPAALAELQRVRRQLESMHASARGPIDAAATGTVLALAYPDRLAQRRGAVPGTFRLANGRGAKLTPASPLARAGWLAVAELDDTGANATILLAAELAPDLPAALFPEHVIERTEVAWDVASEAVRATRRTRLGELVLAEATLLSIPPGEALPLLLGAIRKRGVEALPWPAAAHQLRGRVELVRRHLEPSWPDLSDAALVQALDVWLAPWLGACTSLADLATLDYPAILRDCLGAARRASLDALAPAGWRLPTGRSLTIDYAADPPAVAARVQDLFGVDHHPTVLGDRLPLAIALLSPAGRPVQVTSNLPGFWRGSYVEVRKDMRGRYPKHPWPEQPWLATPPVRPAR